MKRYTPEDFREIVNRHAADDDIDDMLRAADFVIGAARDRGDQLGEADLQSAHQLARIWGGGSATANPNEIRSTPLSDTAYSRQTEADWLDAFSSFIARVREKAFGTPDALFGVESLAEVHERIEEADLRERRAEIDPDSEVAKLESEIQERMGRLNELAPRLFEFSRRWNGLYFTYLNSDNQLRPMEIDSVPKHFIDSRGFLDSDLPPIAVVAIAAHQMAEITGFESHDLLLYILTDIRPRLRRVVVRGMQVYNYLPDRDGNYSENGTEVTGTIVEISVRTPDLTFRELQKVNRKIRVMWEDLGHSPMGEERQHPRLTRKDRQLMEIIESLDVVPERPKAEYWESVHELWVAAGYNAGPGKRNHPDSHRRHWRILEQKLEIPGVAPTVGTRAREQTPKED